MMNTMHDITSSKPLKGSQNHELLVHSAHNSAAYKCLLKITTGRIMDSAEQHVSVEGMPYASDLYVDFTY